MIYENVSLWTHECMDLFFYMSNISDGIIYFCRFWVWRCSGWDFPWTSPDCSCWECCCVVWFWICSFLVRFGLLCWVVPGWSLWTMVVWWVILECYAYFVPWRCRYRLIYGLAVNGAFLQDYVFGIYFWGGWVLLFLLISFWVLPLTWDTIYIWNAVDLSGKISTD